MKLTPKFPPHIKPVRKGVYRTRFCNESGYSYWSGLWGNQGATMGEAIELWKRFKSTGAEQNKSWWGIDKN